MNESRVSSSFVHISGAVEHLYSASIQFEKAIPGRIRCVYVNNFLT